jgi:hypothetical protein
MHSSRVSGVYLATLAGLRSELLGLYYNWMYYSCLFGPGTGICYKIRSHLGAEETKCVVCNPLIRYCSSEDLPCCLSTCRNSILSRPMQGSHSIRRNTGLV